MVYFGFFNVIGEASTYGTYLLTENLIGLGGEPPEAVSWPRLAVSVLFSLWGTCWFSATAVLAWDRRHAKLQAGKVEVVSVPRVSADDLRALREARMPGRPDV